MAFIASGAIGGACFGAALGLGGAANATEVVGALGALGALVVVAACVVTLTGKQLLPQRTDVTPQRWLEEGDTRWAIKNGAALGIGFLSRIEFLTWYVMILAAFMTRSVIAGGLIGCIYGLTRNALPVLTYSWSRRSERPYYLLQFRPAAMKWSLLPALVAGLALVIHGMF